MSKDLKNKNHKKVVIVGASGRVGKSVAFELIINLKEILKSRDEEVELVLLGRSKRIRAAFNDIESSIKSLSFSEKILDKTKSRKLRNPKNIKVRYSINKEDLGGADVIIMAAGISASSIGSDNREAAIPFVYQLIENYGKAIKEYAPNSTVLLITNPVDITTNMMVDFSGLSPEKVLGFGCDIDAIRFSKALLSEFEKIGIEDLEIESRVIGGHSEQNMIVLQNSIIINDQPFFIFKDKFPEEKKKEIDFAVENAKIQMREEGFSIVRDGGKSEFTTSGPLAEIAVELLLSSYESLSANCSMVLTEKNSFHGIKNACLSVPIVIKNGKISIDNSIHVKDEEYKELLAVSERHKQIQNKEC